MRLSTPELSCVQLHLLKINVSGLFLSVLACECYLYFLQTGPVASNMHSTGAPGAMIHVQASLPQGILGLNSISTHGANVRASLHGLLLHHFLGKNIGISRLTRLLSSSRQMSQYAVGGQPSPGLQTQQQLFPPPHSQQVFTLAQNTQQVLLFARALCLEVPTKTISRTFLK